VNAASHEVALVARAAFREFNMPLDLLRIGGQELKEVTLDHFTWIFRFGNGVELRVHCQWRLVVNGHISLTSEDHGQRFGLPDPIDSEAQCRSLLLGHRTGSVEIREDTKDIVIWFLSGARLDILPLSSGYENWQINTPGGVQIIAQGGGNLAEFR
jgi:hypothetical protein